MTTPTILHGDCLVELAKLPDNSIDSVVTDPPYGLSFMGKRWDYDVPAVAIWEQVLRVLKPGGYLLSFGGTRTYHRLVVNIEDAGFEVRDQIAWVHGQGFPKTRDISKDIDKALGAQRAVVGTRKAPGFAAANAEHGAQARGTLEFQEVSGEPITPEAAAWSGWGTALKPAMEPIVVARKPLDATVAKNVLAHGVGALNIDGCRVGETGGTKHSHQAEYPNGTRHLENGNHLWRTGHEVVELNAGRYPTNVLHDGEVGLDKPFFYCAKPSAAEKAGTRHPTVKPLALMQYLCRLVTPPGGSVLDPFGGSGTTAVAAVMEGFTPTIIEREAEYVADIRRRLGVG